MKIFSTIAHKFGRFEKLNEWVPSQPVQSLEQLKYTSYETDQSPVDTSFH